MNGQAKLIAAPSPDSAGDGARERTTNLFNEHGVFVWRVLRRMGVAEADVEDICQDVFLTVHRRLADFEARSNIRTWIYGICLRTAANYRRRSHRRHEEPMTTHAEPASRAAPSDTSVASDLDRGLARLSEAKRTVFVLYEFGELSMTEIASLLECPVKTCFSRLDAARRELREFLSEGGDP